jgi:hypothetical protein
VLFPFARKAAGALSTRHSRAPSDLSEGRRFEDSGAKVPREDEDVSEASIQMQVVMPGLDPGIHQTSEEFF